MEDTPNMLNFDSSLGQSDNVIPQVDENMLRFDSPKNQSSYIKVIGVGGGGSNAVNNMYVQGIQGVDFIVCNTDEKSLNNSPVPTKIVLGQLGAGNVPEVGRKAAVEHKEDILEAISHNTQMLFITAGMGGGTGTGAAPVIAELAKQIELQDETVRRILVVAVVTVPFTIEGKKRRHQAEQGIEELKKHVDSILVINNDKLRAFGNLPLTGAFKKADDVLYTAVKGIAEIITVSAYVNIDFHDVNTVMQKSGTALMGAGIGRGEDRAMVAIKDASTSVLLDDNDIRGAKSVLLYFSYSPEHEITMDEYSMVTDYITELTGDIDTDVIWGAGSDESLDDELKITLIATGFEKKVEQGTVIRLEQTSKAESVTQQPILQGEMHIVSREEPIATTLENVSQALASEQSSDDDIRIIHTSTPAQQPEQPVFTQQVRYQQQPTQQPIQQQVYTQQPPYQQSTQQPSQQPGQPNNISNGIEPNPTQGRRFNLEDSIPQSIEETIKPQNHNSFQESESFNTHYSDGINIVSRQAETSPIKSPEVTSVAPAVATAISNAAKAAAEVQPEQPTHPVDIHNFGLPPAVAESLKTEEEDIVETALLEEPIIKDQSDSTEADEEMSLLSKKVDAATNDPDKQARDRFLRIRQLNDLLHNHSDGPERVEKMSTESLTDDEIYRAPHSSQSESSNATMDKKGNFRSLNNFLFGRPD